MISRKKQELRKYLQMVVNPMLKPMVQEIAKLRPQNIMQFIYEYSANKLSISIDPMVSKTTLGSLHNSQIKGTVSKKIHKSAQIESDIRTHISQHEHFKNLLEHEIECVVEATEVKQTRASEHVINQGEIGQQLYIVASGEYDCFKLIDDIRTHLKTYRKGDMFGELAVIYGAPRAATIVSKTKGILYSIDKATYKGIVVNAADRKKKYIEDILSRVHILSEVDEGERQLLRDTMAEEEYNKGDYVVKEGQTSDKFYIVAQGQLQAEKKTTNNNGETIRKTESVPSGAPQTSNIAHPLYQCGDYFGQVSLLRNTVRQASIYVTSLKCKLLVMDRTTFKRVLGSLQNILMRNMEQYKKYVTN